MTFISVDYFRFLIGPKYLLRALLFMLGFKYGNLLYLKIVAFLVKKVKCTLCLTSLLGPRLHVA